MFVCVVVSKKLYIIVVLKTKIPEIYKMRTNNAIFRYVERCTKRHMLI